MFIASAILSSNSSGLVVGYYNSKLLISAHV